MAYALLYFAGAVIFAGLSAAHAALARTQTVSEFRLAWGYWLLTIGDAGVAIMYACLAVAALSGAA